MPRPLRILQLGYFPVTNPLSGGQRRIMNVAAVLRGLGADVSFCAVCPNRPDVSTEDVPLDVELTNWVFRVPHDFERRIIDALLTSRLLFGRFLDRVRRAAADVLWLEHPFLWPAVAKALDDVPRPPAIVFSSHNVEWMMKRDLLAGMKRRDDVAVRALQELEWTLVRAADLTIAVSEHDAAHFQAAGAREVMVVPNGADVPSDRSYEPRFRYFRQRRGIARDAALFVYVSSNHEPNWLGLRELVLEDWASVHGDRDAILVLIGDIGDRLAVERELCARLGDRVLAVGQVSDAEKDLIVSAADCFLLPVMAGGGTNLKTAEALLSGKPIVATTVAFRGFERHTALSQVTIANTPEQFRRAVERQLRPNRDDWISPTATRLYAAQRVPLESAPGEVAWPEIRTRFRAELARWLAQRGLLDRPAA